MVDSELRLTHINQKQSKNCVVLCLVENDYTDYLYLCMAKKNY